MELQEEKNESPYAPPAMPLQPPAMPLSVSNATTQDDRTMGMLVHLLALLTGIVGVLIIWLVKKDQSRFVDHHGKEALNFQLTVLVASFGLVVIGLLTFVGIFIAIPVVWVIAIGALVFEIIACMAANRGEWHRYPMTIRFIK